MGLYNSDIFEEHLKQHVLYLLLLLPLLDLHVMMPSGTPAAANRIPSGNTRFYNMLCNFVSSFFPLCGFVWVTHHHGSACVRNHLFPLLRLSHSNHTIHWFTSPAACTRVSSAGKCQSKVKLQVPVVCLWLLTLDVEYFTPCSSEIFCSGMQGRSKTPWLWILRSGSNL